ncbi:MAG TPA: capsule biosynthesis protein [Ruminococcaceae bacterium]|nr:capsule biosynthesis protein [Oscillospiraceae bacterium]
MANHSKNGSAIKKWALWSSYIAGVLAVAVAVHLGLNALFNSFSSDSAPKKNNEGSSASSNVADGKNEVKLESSVTVINTGDIMVHSTQLDGAKTSDGYDFSDFFKYIKNPVSAADLAVGNLEVTFGGAESGSYKGYPAFNTPDSLADSIKNAGFDLMLTTNNHCYDTGLFGLKRTVSVLKDKGLLYIGTKQNADEKDYIIKNISGIKLGITAYTYENKSAAGQKSLNGNIISKEANDLVNSFNYDRIDEFYARAKKDIAAMKKGGADIVIFYMHWGEEYQLKENVHQDTIAQKLCDLGVDIIIGSHPHVIQPMALLTSSGGDHKTICAYSMGNAISNQRQEIMHPECTTGHTEDGMLLSFKIDKYSDKTTVISSFDVIPTWVNKYRGGSGYRYSVIPLYNRDAGADCGLSGAELEKSRKSYDRTKATVSEGLTEIQNYLGCKVSFS